MMRMAKGDNLRIVCLLILLTASCGQLRDYIIEDSCLFSGLLDIPENTNIYVNGGGTDIAKQIPQPCEMRFRASKEDYILSVEVTTMEFIDCNVEVNIITTTTKKLKCGMSNPGKLFLNQRSVSISLIKGQSVNNYKFQLIITSSRKVVDPGVRDTQPVAVGLVVGIVGGVFLFLIILAVIGVCCYKHTQKLRHYHNYDSRDEHKHKLEEREPSNVSVGVTNSSASYDSSPRAKTKLLHENENSRDFRNNRPRTLDIKNEEKKPPMPPPDIERFVGSPKKSTNNFDFEKDDNDPYDKLDDNKPQPPKSPFLDALHKNPKFKATYKTTEKEAEERRKRISSSSLSQGVNASDASLDSAATPPKLPPVPTVPKSPNSKKKHASIKGRVPRPVSSSEEELGQKVRTSDESDEGTRAPPTKVAIPTEPATPDSITKPDTRHTLKPDRKKSSKSNSKDKKLSDFPDPIQRIGNFEKNQSIRSSRSSKRSNKSPRLGAKKGFGHRRNRGDETDGSRPGTPTSVMDNDLESLPPLSRSGSRQSLYASRSSLYRRRGRSRQNSFTESVASSYAHDDMEVCRHSRTYSRDRYDYSEEEFDGYERPINRNERYKFKSEGDIVHEAREKSTQTLRETATQTGQEESVILQPERVVRRKRRSKSLSAAGTQTSTAKENKAKNENGKARTKSTSSEKPKPKPKPKPRKSTESDLDEKKKKKSSAENLADDTNKDQVNVNNVESYPDSAVVNGHYVQGMPVYPQQGMVQPPYVQHGAPPSAIPPHMVHPGMVAYGMVPPQGQPGVPMMAVQGNVQPGTLPYNGPQAYGIQPPPYQPANVQSGKPKKSKWDLLCEMTDKQQNGPPSETGSLPNSVFVSNPPSNYGDPNLMQPPHIGYYQPQNAQMLPMTINPSVGVPSGPPSVGAHSNGPRSGPPSLQGSDHGPSLENVPISEQPTMLAKKSSWEALKDITDNQYKITYGAQSESMV